MTTATQHKHRNTTRPSTTDPEAQHNWPTEAEGDFLVISGCDEKAGQAPRGGLERDLQELLTELTKK